MSTHNIRFSGEIRKYISSFGFKKGILSRLTEWKTVRNVLMENWRKLSQNYHHILCILRISPLPEARRYSKCPEIWNTKVDKITYANSADPDQTASEEAV